MPSIGVSTTSPKKSSSFNMSPTPAINFIKCRNHHHMMNNIRYKDNINDTSVIIFLIGGQKLPTIYITLLERTSSEVFMMVVVVVHSFLFFILFLFFFFCFQATLPCHRHSILVSWAREGLRSELYPGYFWLPFLFHLPRALRFWIGIFYPHFLTLHSFTDIFPAFIGASLGAGSSSLGYAGLHTDILEAQARPICLFNSQ